MADSPWRPGTSPRSCGAAPSGSAAATRSARGWTSTSASTTRPATGRASTATTCGRAAAADRHEIAATRRLPLIDRHEVPELLAGVDLARPADLGLLVVDHLLPVGDPAGQAAEREHDGEHVRRDAHRAVDDAAVEVDVGVQLLRHEVIVAQRDLLHALGEIEQRILDSEVREDLVAHLLEDLGARVVVL